MKIAKVFAWLFGILAAALMVFSIGLCLVSLNSHAAMEEAPAGAVECAEAFLEALSSGDLAAASQRIYGQPDLGLDRMPGELAGTMIYEAFLDSISYEWSGEFYATEAGIGRKVTVTFLEIPSVTAALDQRSRELLDARVAAAADMTQIYDENSRLRDNVVTEVLQEAVVRGLAEDAKLAARELVLSLVYREGQWWVLLDSALLQVFNGGRG